VRGLILIKDKLEELSKKGAVITRKMAISHFRTASWNLGHPLRVPSRVFAAKHYDGEVVKLKIDSRYLFCYNKTLMRSYEQKDCNIYHDNFICLLPYEHEREQARQTPKPGKILKNLFFG